MINKMTQQFKPNHARKSIISLIFGVIGISTMIIVQLMRDFLYKFIPFSIAPLIGFILWFATSVVMALGLILGIVGLKSTKRSFAIVGIIVCLIGLLAPLIYFLFY